MMWFPCAVLVCVLAEGAAASSSSLVPWVWATSPHHHSPTPHHRGRSVHGYPAIISQHNFLHARPEQKFSQPILVFPDERRSPAIDLGDGTSIGGPVPEDTLLLSDHRGAKKPRYTTIDRHQAERKVSKPQDTHSLPAETLGGLRPNEVFYANNDLLILKGGVFPPHKTYLKDNSITDSSNDRKGKPNKFNTNVIYDGLITRVPAPAKFNINRKDDIKPASEPLLTRRTRSSDENRDRKESSAEPQEELVFSPSRKRSVTAGSKVVHYHYQSRGKGSKPFVDYKIHKDGTFTDAASQRNNFSPSQKPASATKKQSHSSAQTERRPSFVASAQLPPHPEATPEQQHTFRPSAQLPAHPQQQHAFVPTHSNRHVITPSHQHTPPSHTFEEFPLPASGHRPQTRTVSLRGDTHVNFLPPLPPTNANAEEVLHRRVPKSIRSQNIL